MLLELKCKNCGSPLSVDLSDMKVNCSFCKTDYIVSELVTENRLQHIDIINRLTPIAENHFKLHEYPTALKYYTKLVHIDPSDTNIAKYNMCRLGVDLEPSESIFDTFECLTDKERYSHIAVIKSEAQRMIIDQCKYQWRYQGLVGKLKLIVRTWRRYRHYKWLELMVIPLQCVCGEEISRGSLECKCSRTRKEIVATYIKRRRHRNVVITLIVLEILIVLLIYISGHSIT